MGIQNFIQVIQQIGIFGRKGVRRLSVILNINPIGVEDRLKVLESSHFLGLYLFEVVSIDVVPELPEEGLVGMVVNVGLRVGDLEIGASLIKIGKEEIAGCDQKNGDTCEISP